METSVECDIEPILNNRNSSENLNTVLNNPHLLTSDLGGI
jgi:hypothetical protein